MCLIAVLADAGDHVAVHDLNVIEIEEEPKIGRADPVDDPIAIVGVVALEAGMALHGMRVTRELSISTPGVIFFFSAWPTICLNPSTQLLTPASGSIFGRFGGRVLRDRDWHRCSTGRFLRRSP